MFVRDAWYVAAWDHEIGRDLLRRILLNEPVLLYRRQDGTPVALEDRCCHRQAPLSMGKLVGDLVQCPYHGLQFDPSGKCVKIPSQDRIPSSAKVRRYPVVERHHWIWVWMGDPARANPDLIEEFHWLDDPQWRFGGGYLHVEANYLLLVENRLDTPHLPFLDPGTLGTDAFARSELEVTRQGDRIRVERWLMDKPPVSPFDRQMGGLPDGMNVDRWQITHYAPPSFVTLDVGSAPAGAGARQGDRGRGTSMWSLNAITPETEKSAHYFYAQACNSNLGERRISDLVRSQLTKAFLEDMAMLEAQQANMNLGPSPVVHLGQDKACLAMRQIVARLVEEEKARNLPPMEIQGAY